MQQRHMHRHIHILLIALVASAAIMACSTERNTVVSRAYQRLTSSYNVYFNGEEAYDKGLAKIRQGYTNDYSHVLPVYEFSDATAAKAGSGDMETALKKGHKLIQLHSIKTKPKRKQQMTDKDKRFYAQEEFNPYVAKAWLLIGKANTVKHSEDEALEVFDYVVRKHENTDEAHAAKLWKAIAYTQMGQYINAKSALESYDMDGQAPLSLYGEYMTVNANLLISQNKYSEAIPYMEKVLEEPLSRQQKTRYTYILAQLYRETGQRGKAAPLFLKLSRGIRDYDMAFAAKLDLATVASTADELATAEKQLRKMARDEKNAEQLDQIYYALGCFEQRRDNETQAVSNFKTSINKSVSNNHQKGLSFLALADIYIAKPKYIEAGVSFDSAATYLDKSNTRRAEAEQKAHMLAPLVKELQLIEEQDSLLRVANMPTKERDNLIEKMLDEVRKRQKSEAEARLAEQEAGMSQSDFYRITREPGMGGQSQASWYFYNTTMVTAGKGNFIRKWGRRKNEDNWRRSNKASITISDGDVNWDEVTKRDQQNPESEAEPKEKEQSITRESLLAGLPLTDEAKAESNNRIAEALFESGVMLYDDIKDYPSAIAQFDELLRRYPANRNRYNALVILYFAQQKADKKQLAEATATIIKREYAGSDFARQLAQGDALAMREADKQQREQQYERAYNAYLGGQYQEAVAQTTHAMADTANSPYTAKYLLVRSLSYAKQAQTDRFRADLETIAKHYAGGAEDSVAQKLLAMLGEGKMPVKAQEYESPLTKAADELNRQASASDAFEYRADTSHVVVCIVDNGKENRAQYVIADYNFSNYLLDDFDLSIGALADGRSMIVIKGFGDAKAAMSYYYQVREQEFWKELTEQTLPEIYAVGDNNYKLFLLQAVGKDYKDLFGEYYLGK